MTGLSVMGQQFVLKVVWHAGMIVLNIGFCLYR